MTYPDCLDSNDCKQWLAADLLFREDLDDEEDDEEEEEDDDDGEEDEDDDDDEDTDDGYSE